jgi:hypothetical protein
MCESIIIVVLVIKNLRIDVKKKDGNNILFEV